MRHQYTIEGNTTIIHITTKKDNLSYEVLIDTIDLPFILEYGIDLFGGRNKDYYVAIYDANADSHLLHRILLDAPQGIQVDHIDRNKLNCKRDNLRFVTNAENKQNSPVQSNNTSGTPGVFWQINKQKWYARVTINRKNYNLGAFAIKEDAIKAVISFKEKHMPFSKEAMI